MLSMLFDKNFFIGVFSVVIIFLIIWLCVKYPSVRLACLIILTCGFAGLTGYCIVNLNIYYNAQGGIYGEITGLFSSSVSVEEKVITFDNLELIQYLDTDTYYCKIITDKVIAVDENKHYEMYVNDVPCSNSMISAEYISCDYRYQFFGEKEQLLCDDTLQIRLVFNKNNSYFYIFTENGTNSVKYWNYYINKNDFVISIKETNFSKDNEINYAYGEVDELYRVDYVYTDDYVETKYYTKNSHLELVNLVAVENWTIDNVAVSNDYTVNKDLTVKANFMGFDPYLYECVVREASNGYLIGSNENKVGLVYFDSQTEKYSVVSFYGYGWNGTSKIGEDVVVMSSIYNEIDTVIFMESTKTIVHLKQDFDYSYSFSDGNMLKIVGSNANQKGVYLYDVLSNTTTKLYEDDYWTNYKGKWNEFTGSASIVRITNKAGTYYLQYDFITQSLSKNVVSSGEVGF